MKNLITTNDTKKATAQPTSSIEISVILKTNPYFSIFKKLAPNIIGIAKKNVNSEANTLDAPNANAPIIVDPDLDVPGINANTWNNPIMNAIL